MEENQEIVDPAPEERAAEARRARMERLAVRMLWTGVDGEEVRRILAAHELDRIERQLDWLPYRRARRPAALLVASIEDDYDAPRAVRKGSA